MKVIFFCDLTLHFFFGFIIRTFLIHRTNKIINFNIKWLKTI